MMEDKLEHDERLRLECIAQAVQASASSLRASTVTPDRIVTIAKSFERYITDKENTD